MLLRLTSCRAVLSGRPRAFLCAFFRSKCKASVTRLHASQLEHRGTGHSAFLLSIEISSSFASIIHMNEQIVPASSVIKVFVQGKQDSVFRALEAIRFAPLLAQIT